MAADIYSLTLHPNIQTLPKYADVPKEKIMLNVGRVAGQQISVVASNTSVPQHLMERLKVKELTELADYVAKKLVVVTKNGGTAMLPQDIINISYAAVKTV
jgi:hypothetical protein